jgi:hypothetical protein
MPAAQHTSFLLSAAAGMQGAGVALSLAGLKVGFPAERVKSNQPEWLLVLQVGDNTAMPQP